MAATWSVAGVDRASAHLVSQVDGRPAFGGTPSDDSVRDLIAELKARGLKVTLYPFVMMDIAVGQHACPIRGPARRRSRPIPGAGASPAIRRRARPARRTAPRRAAAQVDAFFSGGPDGWNYRRMILHYATLAAGAGGVDAFLIGSELKALTRVRSASGVYPAVECAGDACRAT